MKIMKKMCLAAALSLLLLAISGCAKKQESLQELLDLGRKYLLEENYEEAVVTFEKAIAVDEKSVDAYIGLADAYAGKGDSKKAKEVLERGYEKIGEQALLDKRKDYPASEPEDTKGTEETGGEHDSGDGGDMAAPAVVQSSPELEELLSILQNGSPLDVMDLLQSEAVKNLLDAAGGSILLPVTGDPAAGEGTGLGVYYLPENDIYAVYYGSYSRGKRSGEGVWSFGGGYFEGQWENDAPNGAGKVTYSGGMTDEGTLTDGKWNGEVVQRDGRVWHFNFTDGYPVTLGVDENADEGDPYHLLLSREYESENAVYVCSEEQAAVPWGIIGFVPLFPN